MDGGQRREDLGGVAGREQHDQNILYEIKLIRFKLKITIINEEEEQ